MVEVYIGFGSNIGDRYANIRRAIAALEGNPAITVEKISSFRETEPWGGPPQNRYINAVAKLWTAMPARTLLGFILDIEQKMGRVRTVKNGPRTIDLDILLYGEEIIDEKDLIVPHPRMFERDFVMEPLFEIAPDIKGPLERLQGKNVFISKA